MKVKLLNHALENYNGNGDSIGYENLVVKAAAICVDKLDNPTEKGMMNALNSGHLSIIEHLPITFLIEDVSRALTHQLVRHRLASYSQQSQRYAKIDTDKEWFIIPDTIKNTSDSSQDLYTEYMLYMHNTAQLYNKLCNAGIPNEDARMVLPNACFTSIIMTMNARSFIEQCEKRLCNKAQWEIRAMYKEMRNLIKDIYPTVYKLAIPNCMKTECREEKQCKLGFADLE